MTTPASASERARYFARSGHDITPLDAASVAQLAGKLDEEAYRVTQKAGTEPPFCGNLLDNKMEGAYACVVCGLPLFASEHKFNSGTGWPSFFAPVDEDHIVYRRDAGHGMVRIEVACQRCNAHLGHVFEDGPKPTGLRYCLNSAALVFHEQGAPTPSASQPFPEDRRQVAYFAGGCFWGIEHYFQLGPGVIDAVSGYMNGSTAQPTYEQVCSGRTGHAEAVKVVFDPDTITYKELLEAFFVMHDPTQLNRQGPDVGDQYRSGIYAADDAQLSEARAFIEAQQASGNWRSPIATEVAPAGPFHPAEAYHQDYIQKTGRACHVRDPWGERSKSHVLRS